MKIGLECKGGQVELENDSRPSKWTIIKSVTREASLNSTIHGLPSSLRTEILSLKISWLLCFTCSAICGTFLVVLMCKAFFRYETVTNIETVREMPAPFPAISKQFSI
jgi:hypothetical protein